MLCADPGNIPAEPEKTRQDPDGTGEKVSQNPSKIWSGRVPGASGIGPGTRPSEEKAKKRFPAAKNPQDFFAAGGFGAILGPGREPQIDQKRARGRKSASGDGAGSDFCRFFLAVALRSRSPDRFLEGLTLENADPTTAGARF